MAVWLIRCRTLMERPYRVLMKATIEDMAMDRQGAFPSDKSGLSTSFRGPSEETTTGYLQKSMCL